jgi:outer membrane protein, adhesin transport system
MGRIGILRSLLLASCIGVTAGVANAGPFTINDALRMAVQTNPIIGEAAANRRATEAELRQTQSTLLPQVRLEAQAGPERLNNPAGQIPGSTTPTLNNGQWVAGAKGSIFVRQLLFDGFTSLHEVWRQTARVDAAAARTHERSELTALDASEAYIDVVRYTRLVALAQENVAAHRKILGNVQQRFQGGRAGQGDLEQTNERVDAAEVTLTEFQRSLEDARAKFRKVIGIEPYNLRGPARLPGLPGTKDHVLAVTLTDNPTIKAAQADSDAAREAFRASAGAFMPNVALEARGTEGHDTDTFPGHFSEESLKVVASWDIFRGGQDTWKRVETAEQYNQTTMAHARLQRDANESVDKAWAARVITSDRIIKLQTQVEAAGKVISAYSKEYDLGQRSLIDLLNAENTAFNAQVSLISARSVAIFADYQLLAAMGKLLDYVRAPHPVDAEPVAQGPYGLIPVKLPPILIGLPQPGPEPLNVAGPVTAPPISGWTPPVPDRPLASAAEASQASADAPRSKTAFSDRWLDPTTTVFAPLALQTTPQDPQQLQPPMTGSDAKLGFSSATGAFSPSQMLKMPNWPLRDARAD